MKRAIWAIGLAGLSSGASAGVGGGNPSNLVVSLTFDRNMISFDMTAIATVTARWDGPPGSYMSSVGIDLIAMGPQVEIVNLMPILWNNPTLGFNGQGTVSGSNILGLNASQFSLIPPFTATNPILITRFGVRSTGDLGYLSFAARTAEGLPFPFSVTGPLFSDPVVEFGLDAFESGTLIIICPTPGVLGVMVAGLAAVGRRRR